MNVTIPGALADHLTGQTITDAATAATLDAARRGRGRTLVIEPTSTRVLHVISSYAEAILDNRTLHTAAEARAARLWIQRAGHSVPAPADAEQAATLVDPWTWIRRPSSSDAAKAAEKRAERRQHLADSRGASAYEPAAAAVRQVVRELPLAGALSVPVTEGSPEATLTRDDLHALAYSGYTTVEAVARVRAAVAAHIRHGEREVHLMFPARGMRPALYLPDVMALLHRWDGQTEASEQFARTAPATPAHEPIVARARFHPADLDRIKAKAATDRAAYRSESDDRIAAECAAHGVAPSQGVRDRIAARAVKQAPARRVIEGVVVQHAGTAEGSTPSDTSDPDVIAARAALDGLAAATMTDHHDVTQPTEDERTVRGYLIDPRGVGRIALYWLEEGRIVHRDEQGHGTSLDCLAWTMEHAGWTVEKLLRSSQCVFAHRPQ